MSFLFLFENLYMKLLYIIQQTLSNQNDILLVFEVQLKHL